jgi:hypothetical protein
MSFPRVRGAVVRIVKNPNEAKIGQPVPFLEMPSVRDAKSDSDSAITVLLRAW